VVVCDSDTNGRLGVWRPTQIPKICKEHPALCKVIAAAFGAGSIAALMKELEEGIKVRAERHRH
jgi:hypothetical protein